MKDKLTLKKLYEIRDMLKEEDKKVPRIVVEGTKYIILEKKE